MPRRGRKRKKTRTHVVDDENARSALASSAALKVPRSVVIRRGKVEAEVVELVSDIRKMMRPYTALHLKEDTSKNRKAKLSDYAAKLTGALGVTHLMALTQNHSHINLRVARTPSGPTLAFQVRQFSLTRHVASSQRRPYYTSSLFDHAPIVVTNNFGDQTAAPHVKLMRITFQNLFPAINVANVNLSDCRRVVLFNLTRRKEKKTRRKQHDDSNNEDVEHEDRNATDAKQEEEDVVEVRHYAIRASPVGVDRKVRKLVQANIPNLGRLEDVSDYLMGSGGGESSACGGGAMSDSEVEDETSHVVLPQSYHGRGNAKSQKSALKLVEMGPRICLSLVKIERGLAAGDVMYHSYIHRTPEEAKAQKLRVEQAAALKKQRREQQEANVLAKVEAREAKKAAKKAVGEERKREAMEALRGGLADRTLLSGKGNISEEDDTNDRNFDGQVHSQQSLESSDQTGSPMQSDDSSEVEGNR